MRGLRAGASKRPGATSSSPPLAPVLVSRAKSSPMAERLHISCIELGVGALGQADVSAAVAVDVGHGVGKARVLGGQSSDGPASSGRQVDNDRLGRLADQNLLACRHGQGGATWPALLTCTQPCASPRGPSERRVPGVVLESVSGAELPPFLNHRPKFATASHY